MEADRHPILASGRPRDTKVWLEKYGYRCAVTGLYDGLPVSLLFCRPGQPVEIVFIGDTLRYDGRKKIVVIDYREETV